ncbi:uncharacterized protein LOC111049020 [Nilaparvata lugens]|uniref:uncharacterized protein LOC111049020 n=1 Tax=Nilaparvata lugens TaxID=108931 RepID=UPI00193E4963|nr:uncharacterized protein LOC111049020 [Nilaparvata lugens]
MEVTDTNNVEQHFEKLNLTVTTTSPSPPSDRSAPDQSEETDESGSAPPAPTANRRCMLRPRKRVSGEFGNVDPTSPSKIGRQETTPTLKMASVRRNPNLETIFEEPVVKKNGAVVLIGASKIKRSITFQQFVSKTKAKKRKALVKKFNFGRRKKTSLTLNDVKVKLLDLDNALHMTTND